MAVVLFVASAVAVTWPLATQITSAIPRGTEVASTVPLFNLWTLWWNSAWAGMSTGYWDAPIFSPAEKAFALSEPQPTMAAVVPLLWCGGTPALALNVYILGALVLNGLSAAQLLRAVRVGRSGALAAGLFVQWLPFVQWQIGVLQLAPLFGELWTILALVRIGQRPTIGAGLRLGIAFALAYLTCENLGLLFCVLMMASGPWLIWRGLRSPRMWTAIACGAIVSGLLIAPVVLVQARMFRAKDFTRTRELAISLSAEPADYSVTFASPIRTFTDWRLLDFSDPERREYWPLSPGWIKVALAVAGVVAGLRVREWRSWTGFAMTFLALAWLLSLGPEARWRTLAPYDFLRVWFPGFEHIRNVFRFALFVQLATAWLAGMGIDGGLRLGERSRGESATPLARKLAVRFAAVVLLALGCVESLPAPQALTILPPQKGHRAWLNYLRDETPADAVLLCLPMPDSPDVVAYELETWWMYSQMVHRRRLANGYSGYFPPAYMALQGMSHGYPAEPALEAFANSGVTHLVIDRRVYDDAGSRLGDESRWKRVFQDPRSSIDIYQRESRP